MKLRLLNEMPIPVPAQSVSLLHAQSIKSVNHWSGYSTHVRKASQNWLRCGLGGALVEQLL